jgi:hypothetical protein
MKTLVFSSLLTIFTLPVIGQENTQATDTLRKDALNVFMESSDYIKKEIPYVNYVRDIKEAGVYIISTSQATGSGGREYTYYLVGQHQFAGMRDTISYTSSPDETYENIRANEVKTLKMGLMRYVQKTPLSKFLAISFSKPMSETVSTDKWNSWVFRTSVDGFLDGEKLYKQSNIFGNISARRVTKDWKINFNGSYSKGLRKFEFPDTIIRSENFSKSFNSLIVRSINDHWSYGGSASVSSSSYSNYDMLISLMPGIEYNIFPYSESTRRQLRLQYLAGYNYANYIDSTIYDKTKENLWKQSLSASYEIIQKWGSIDIGMSFGNYLHDWSKNNLNLNGFIELST